MLVSWIEGCRDVQIGNKNFLKVVAKSFGMRIMRLPRLSQSADRFFNKIDQAMRVGTCGGDWHNQLSDVSDP